jgi:hypothetical protein
MKLRLSIALVALMMTAVGCGDDGQSTPPMGGNGGSGGSGGLGGSGGTGGTPISFADDILPYFEPDVADCVLCHSGGGAPAGVRLDSYANMVASNGPLWVAGDSSMGTLIPQLLEEPDHNGGPDDAAFVDNLLSPWIDQGALDN